MKFLSKTRTVSVAVIGLCIVGTCSAETLTIDEARAYALANSPAAKSIDVDYSTKLREALETGAMANPEIEYSRAVPVRKAGQDPDDESELSLSQRIRISDFGSRSEVKRLIGESASLEQQLAVLELSQNLKLAYTRLWGHQEKIRQLDEAKTQIEKLSTTVNKALASGVVGKGQALTFEAEAKKLEAQKIGVHGDFLDAKASLVKLTSYPKLIDKVEKPTLSKIIAENQIENFLTADTFPLRKRAELRAKIAKAQLSTAKKDAYPSLTPKIFYGKSAEGFDQVGGGIALEIPLWYRNEGEINQRRAEAALGESERTYYVGEGFKSELLTTRRKAEEYSSQSDLYGKQVIPRLKEALNQLIKGYDAGSAGVFEVLQAQRELLDAQSESLDLYIKALASQVELSVMIGNEF